MDFIIMSCHVMIMYYYVRNNHMFLEAVIVYRRTRISRIHIHYIRISIKTTHTNINK